MGFAVTDDAQSRFLQVQCKLCGTDRHHELNLSTERTLIVLKCGFAITVES
jgi:hypothetical protein